VWQLWRHPCDEKGSGSECLVCRTRLILEGELGKSRYTIGSIQSNFRSQDSSTSNTEVEIASILLELMH
jgi:hypothetical protein